MKKGSYLINTARGGLIDTTAMIKLLKSKHIAGAGLDVLEEEELLITSPKKKRLTKSERDSLYENHQLMKMDNVILTPHNAFNSQEALERILETTIKNIECFTKKGKCLNQIK